jgi:transcriptional regulator of acetoin/glycerol metabolism
MTRPPKFTKEELVKAIEANDHDLTRAAVALDVSPSTVYRAMERHGIQVVTERRTVISAA